MFLKREIFFDFSILFLEKEISGRITRNGALFILLYDLMQSLDNASNAVLNRILAVTASAADVYVRTFVPGSFPRMYDVYV